MSKAKPAPKAEPARPPSADTLIQLEKLLVGRLTAEKVAEAWRLITAAQANPDFFAVQDYAVEHGFAVPCGTSDPKREPNPTWVNPLDGSEMVWIPPGKCRLGPDAKPDSALAAPPVEIDGFSLAKYPVTNEQFAAFLAATEYESHETADADGVDRGDYENAEFLTHWTDGKPPRAKNRPVVYVSYLDALAYCAWAGLSVPGEFQWEKAARGTDGRRYPWGNTVPYASKKKVSNVGSGAAAAVTEFADVRSPYGCVQMVGNVATWCQTSSPKTWSDAGAVPPAHPKSVPPTEGEPRCAAARSSGTG